MVTDEASAMLLDGNVRGTSDDRKVIPDLFEQ